MNFLPLITILQVAPPVDNAMNGLLQYGILGIFAVLMIITIKWLTKEYKKQNDKIIDAYTEQIKNLVAERNATLSDKNELNDKFLIHLQDTESKLLNIISENSKAFQVVAASNESVSEAISLLIESIHNRNESSDTLNETIKTIIKNKG